MAVAEYLQHHAEKSIYVERRGGLYRWSPVVSGGGYAMLRSIAQLLGLHHTSIVVAFDTLATGQTTAADPAEPPPDASQLFDELPTDPHTIVTAIKQRLSG